MNTATMPGAEPFSAEGGPEGALVLHGFTGDPRSMRGVAERLAGAGLTVDLPLLPGHGTTVADLVPMRWDDWAAAADEAYSAIARRCERVAVVGLSMGGGLACWLGVRHPEIRGLALVNPIVKPPGDELRNAVRELLSSGTAIAPGIGSDIADPAVKEQGYDGTPLAAALSLFEGVEELALRLGEIRCPVLLLSSREDHVVTTTNGDLLVASVAGPCERVWLERSYHVATLDYDRQLVEDRITEFVVSVTSAGGAGVSDPPALGRDDVAHVAVLARLALGEEELERYTGQLARVIEHARDVAALDVAGVAPTAHPLPVRNVLRPDVPGPCLTRDDALAAAPEVEDGRFKVPRIVGDAP